MDLHGNSRSDTCNKTKQSRMCYVHTGSHINYSLELHKNAQFCHCQDTQKKEELLGIT